ncbi:SWIM domain-containing protein [Cephalotus follicularis]|uniref:SWIM domain-containing protein n=1 Tax=Cephalotus follicularis TaxID=3775 RepID=A0A1Q3CG75_CEPFO|nr:SWIM domain-containing protein [Cephalotus follicularis]
MANKHCSCEEWSISGLLCKHVVTCIPRARARLEDLWDEFFSIKKYLKTYENIIHIHPLPEESLDATDGLDKLQSPTLGRLRRDRMREPNEGEKQKRSSTVKCFICHQFGHNMRGCQRDTRPNMVNYTKLIL